MCIAERSPTHLEIVFEIDFEIVFEIVFEIDFKIVSQPVLCLSFQIGFNVGWNPWAWVEGLSSKFIQLFPLYRFCLA